MVMPQWQGGDNPLYYLGSNLLNWLAPENNDPTEIVSVYEPSQSKLFGEEESGLTVQEGIVGRDQLLAQLTDAKQKIEKHVPDNIVMFGGDCLVSLAPFAYLNSKYEDDMAVIWIDSHPDIMTPEQYKNAHAMVLGNLMGYGDEAFSGVVPTKVKPKNVMYVGVGRKELNPYEKEFIESNNIRLAEAEEMKDGNSPVLEWLKKTGAKHVAIHFDIDSLLPSSFRSQLFANPAAEGGHDAADMATGGMTLEQVVTLMNEVQAISSVVGITIAEHLPWEAQMMKQALHNMPLIGK